MKNQSVIKAIFTALSAGASMKPENPQEEELQRYCIEIFNDVMLASLQKAGLESNLYFVNADGVPQITTKGHKALFSVPETKVVEKLPNVRKIEHDLLVALFNLYGKEVCYRFKNFPAFKKMVNRNEINETVNCIDDSLFLNPQLEIGKIIL
jgi:hypothetical protein